MKIFVGNFASVQFTAAPAAVPAVAPRAATKPSRASKARQITAKRLRKQNGIANGSLVVCPQCGDRFSLAHKVPCSDPYLVERHVEWLLDQFVWDHIQENQHRHTIALPNAEELTRWTRSNHGR